MQFLVRECHHQHSCDQGLPVGDNEVVLSLALLLQCMQLWPGVRQKEKHKNIRSALHFCHQKKSDIVWCTLVPPGNSWKASKCAKLLRFQHGNRRSTEKCNEKDLDQNYIWGANTDLVQYKRIVFKNSQSSCTTGDQCQEQFTLVSYILALPQWF